MGVPYAIIRPTLVFGEGDLLLHNTAWALRRFPVFPVFGNGDYTVQPVYAGDVAYQAVEADSRCGNLVAGAAGPETFTFEKLLRVPASAVGARIWLVHTPTSVGFRLTRMVGLLLRDVVLTREEVDGLIAGLLTSATTPTGTTMIGDWLSKEGSGLGWRYTSEIRRNYWRYTSTNEGIGYRCSLDFGHSGGTLGFLVNFKEGTRQSM